MSLQLDCWRTAASLSNGINALVLATGCDRSGVRGKIKAVGDRIAILSGDDDLGVPTFLAWQPRRDLHEREPRPGLPPPAFRGFGDRTDRLCSQGALRAPAADRSPLHRNPPGPLKDAMVFVGHPVGLARAPLQGASAEALQRAELALRQLAAREF